MVAPATSQIAEEFGMTTNTVIQAMVTSVFVLGYGMSELPIFWNKKVQNSLISCPQAFGPLVRKNFASNFAFPSLLSFFLGSWSDEWIVGTIEGFAVGQSLLPRSVLSLLLSFHIYNSIALSLFSTVWNIGCGFAQNKGQLIAFRFLSGLGGSAPLAVR